MSTLPLIAFDGKWERLQRLFSNDCVFLNRSGIETTTIAKATTAVATITTRRDEKTMTAMTLAVQRGLETTAAAAAKAVLRRNEPRELKVQKQQRLHLALFFNFCLMLPLRGLESLAMVIAATATALDYKAARQSHTSHEAALSLLLFYFSAVVP